MAKSKLNNIENLISQYLITHISISNYSNILIALENNHEEFKKIVKEKKSMKQWKKALESWKIVMS